MFRKKVSFRRNFFLIDFNYRCDDNVFNKFRLKGVFYFAIRKNFIWFISTTYFKNDMERKYWCIHSVGSEKLFIEMPVYKNQSHKNNFSTSKILK